MRKQLGWAGLGLLVGALSFVLLTLDARAYQQSQPTEENIIERINWARVMPTPALEHDPILDAVAQQILDSFSYNHQTRNCDMHTSYDEDAMARALGYNAPASDFYGCVNDATTVEGLVSQIETRDEQGVLIARRTKGIGVAIRLLGNQLGYVIVVGEADVQARPSPEPGEETPSETPVETTEAPPTPAPNLPPTLEGFSRQTLMPSDVQSLPISVTDPDEDAVALSVDSSNPLIADAQVHESNLLLTAISAGETVITLSANDGINDPVSTTFILEVTAPSPTPEPSEEPEPSTPDTAPPSSRAEPGEEPEPPTPPSITETSHNQDCSNTAANDWNAPVMIYMQWDANSFTLWFESEADCIWVYGLSFVNNVGRYVLADDPGFSNLRSTQAASVSFSGFPTGRCLQLQSRQQDGVVIPNAHCNVRNTYVSNQYFPAPAQFFWRTDSSGFSVTQLERRTNPCRPHLGECSFMWNNSADYHREAPVDLFIQPLDGGVTLIRFESIMPVIDLTRLRIGWLGPQTLPTRTWGVSEHTWYQNGVPVNLQSYKFGSLNCLIIARASQHDQQFTLPSSAPCEDVFFSYSFQATEALFWDADAFPDGYYISRDGGVKYPDDLHCGAGMTPCELKWLP